MLILISLVFIISGAYGRYYSENENFDYVNVNGDADYKLNHMVNNNGRISAKKVGPFKPQLADYFQKLIPISSIEDFNQISPFTINFLHHLYSQPNRIPVEQSVVSYVAKQLGLTPSKEDTPVLEIVYPKHKKNLKHYSHSSSNSQASKKFELPIDEDFDNDSDEDFADNFNYNFDDDFGDFNNKFNLKLPYLDEIVSDETYNDKNTLHHHKIKKIGQQSHYNSGLEKEIEDMSSEEEFEEELPSEDEEVEFIEPKRKHGKKFKKPKRVEYFSNEV